MDPLHAVAPEPRRPEVAAGVPRGLREVLVLEPPPGLEHEHPVALLGGPQRGHRPTEARADDEDVDVDARDGIRIGEDTVDAVDGMPCIGIGADVDAAVDVVLLRDLVVVTAGPGTS